MTEQNGLETVVLEPTGAHRATLIWLHGLGADGYDFVPIVRELNLPQELGVRFVFPHAPQRRVTVNGGFRMRAWYDVRYPDLSVAVDEAGVRESVAAVLALADQEQAQVGGWDKVMLAGFSQGGAISLQAGLSSGHPFAGLLALSTYLPIRAGINPDNKIPIFWGHGTFDPVVPYLLGKSSKDLVESLDFPLTWRHYPMAHSLYPEEIDDIRDWLQTRLAPVVK